MVASKAATVKEYLNTLPADRRATLDAVRQVILDNLDPDYEEGMDYGMICYYVPHRIYPPGYHVDPKRPLGFAALAAQKNHYSLYLMGLYCGCGLDPKDPTPESVRFRKEWEKTGKKLDMGKSCVRFRKLEDLALDVLGREIARFPVKTYLRRYEAALGAIADRKKRK